MNIYKIAIYVMFTSSFLFGQKAANRIKRNLLLPGTEVNLSIRGVPLQEAKDFNINKVVIDNKGYIKLHLLKKLVLVKGLTVAEAARKIEKIYIAEKIYTNPVIYISSSATSEKSTQLTRPRVFISGEVRKAGPIFWQEGLTLFQAINVAGGRTQYAGSKIYLRRITIDKKGKTSEKTIKLNLKKSLDSNLPIKPNDQIIVRQKGFF